jgi:hypothetical protein
MQVDLILMKGFIAGVLATVAMDLCALIGIHFKIFNLGGLQIVPKFLGRWTLAMAGQRKIFFEDLRIISPYRREELFGLLIHYLIGVILGVIFFYFSEMMQIRNLFFWGIFYGFCTNIFPWFLMYPCMGFGILAKKVRAGTQILQFACINHIVYGAALGALADFVLLKI